MPRAGVVQQAAPGMGEHALHADPNEKRKRKNNKKRKKDPNEIIS